MRKILRGVLPLLLILLIAGLFLLPQRIIPIKTIDCETQFGKCDSYLLDKMGKLKGKTLMQVRRDIKNILKNDILIEDSQIQFSLPNEIKVFVVLRKPKYALKSIESNKFSLVDETGSVISNVAETNLPYIEVGGEATVGQKINDKLLFALNLISDTFYLYQTKKGSLEMDKLVVELPAGPKVLFPLVGDKEVLIGSLRLILSRIESDGELSIDNIREVDLRFKNPVVR